MTAAPLSLKVMRDEHQRPHPQLLRRVLAVFVVLEALLLLALTLAFSGSAHAEERVKGELSVFTDGGFIRLAFRFDQEIPATIRAGFPIMVVTFSKPVAVSVSKLVCRLERPYQCRPPRSRRHRHPHRAQPEGEGQHDPGGRAAVRRPVAGKLERHAAWAAAGRGRGPRAPRRRRPSANCTARRARTRSASRRPSGCGSPVSRPSCATCSTCPTASMSCPTSTTANSCSASTGRSNGIWPTRSPRCRPTLKSIDADIDYNSVTINFVLNGKPKVRSFHEDRGIVVDIGLDGAPAKQAAAQPAPAAAPAAPAAVPGIAAPDTVPAEAAPGDAKPAAPPLVDQPPLGSRCAVRAGQTGR